MARVFTIACLFVCIAASGGLAQTGQPTVHGMTVTTLDGAYEIDAGGVPLRGYVDQQAGSLQAAQKVAFHVCNSDRVLQVTWGQLHDSPPCRSAGHPIWDAWRLEGGNLVARSAGGGAEAVSLRDLPSSIRSILGAAPTGAIDAFSFPSPTGKILGIIKKPEG